MKGFSAPLSPEGRASLTPAPPWFYVSNLLAVDYWADPDAVAAVLPPGSMRTRTTLAGCGAFFADWRYASARGDEPLDPARSQYHEFILLVNGRYRGKPVSTCPYLRR